MNAPTTKHSFHPSILREYDIRGVVGETLVEADARALGRSFGTMLVRRGLVQRGLVRRGLVRRGLARVAVGRDGRLSSPALEAALVEGLVSTGVDVVRIGCGPTPMLYLAEAELDGIDAGIQVTGSHNPGNHNGFKMVVGHAPFFAGDITALGQMAAAGDWETGVGSISDRPMIDRYVDRLVEGLSWTNRDGSAGDALGALAGMRIGWDAGNGAAGEAMAKLVARLPGEHFLLYADVDGHFPNHHPDPTVEANLADLKALVAAKKLDFGVAFDGDGDRIGAVDGQGRVIWGDQLLMIYAEDLLRLVPGAPIIADVKASQALFDHVVALGGQPDMWKTGHSLIKTRMKQIGSPLAGEMSGHIFFAHDFYGFDDALYAAIRLIVASARLGKSVTELRGAMPPMINTPELRFAVDDTRKFAVIDEVLARLRASGADLDETDGARVKTADGWWLLRASNTQDVLVARAEAADEAALGRLLAQIDDQLALSGLERGDPVPH